MDYTGRKSLLLRRKAAQQVLANPALPEPVKALAQRVLNHSEAVLSLQDAMENKKQRERQDVQGDLFVKS